MQTPVAASPASRGLSEPSAASPAALEPTQAADSSSRPTDAKTETDRESVGSSNSARPQESDGQTTESAAEPEEKKQRQPMARKSPAAKMPSKAKVAAKTVDVVASKQRGRPKTPAREPKISKALSFSAYKVRGERSTTLRAFQDKKQDAAPKARTGFAYTPYKGPLPPFSNSLFAPKEIQALERLENKQPKPNQPVTPVAKKPFLVKGNGIAGGVVGRGAAEKENTPANTAANTTDKRARRPAKPVEATKKQKKVLDTGRVSVMNKTTLSFQAKMRAERRATIESSSKSKAQLARQKARRSTPAVTAKPSHAAASS